MKAAAESTRATGARAGIERRMAVVIVGRASFRVTQRLVGLTDFLEFFLGRFVTRIFVRMKFDGQLAVGLFDFLIVGVAADAEHLVIIALGHDSGCGRRRRFFGDHDRRRPQQTVTQFVTFADLLDDPALGRVSGFQLRNGFVQHRVKRFAMGVNFFQAGFGQNAFELLLNHRNAGLQGNHPALRDFRGMRGGLRHFKMIKDGQQFLQQRGVGGLGGFNALARGAFFEIFKIGGGAEQAVPMFVGFGGASLEFLQLPRREFRSGSGGGICRRGGRRGFSRFGFRCWYCRFLHAFVSVKNNFKPSS